MTRHRKCVIENYLTFSLHDIVRCLSVNPAWTQLVVQEAAEILIKELERSNLDVAVVIDSDWLSDFIKTLLVSGLLLLWTPSVRRKFVCPGSRWWLSDETPIVLRRSFLSQCRRQKSNWQTLRAWCNPLQKKKPRAERPPGRRRARPQTHDLPSSANTGVLSGPKTVHDASHAGKKTQTKKNRTTTWAHPPDWVHSPPLSSDSGQWCPGEPGLSG